MEGWRYGGLVIQFGMPPAETIRPPKPPSGIPVGSFCAYEDRETQGIVHFRIDSVTLGRLKRKAGNQGDDPAKFALWLWDNIIHPGIDGAAY